MDVTNLPIILCLSCGDLKEPAELSSGVAVLAVCFYCSTGSGVALMSNFEQLLRGVWRPETNEILHMSL